MEFSNYHELACDLAINAAEANAEGSRGVWYLEKEDLLCFCDNHPYEVDAVARRRQNSRIANRVQRAGIEILAETHDGRDEATVMLFACSKDRIQFIQQIVSDEVNETLKEFYSDF